MTPPPFIRLARLAMATRFELVIADDGDASNLQAIGEEALDEISNCEQLLSVHREDGGLFQLNAHAANKPMRTDARICDFIERAQEMAALTDGTCDIAVGPLLDAWRIHRGKSLDVLAPDTETIHAALQLVDVRAQVQVDHQRQTVYYSQPGVRLDPGALGKGWAINRAVTILQEYGVVNALLHGGTSSVYALGAPPGKSFWDISIRNPHAESAFATAHLSHNGLSVSALHGRQLVTGGTSHGHIIDPRSGHPVGHTMLSAVTHRDSVVAEAWSTALLIDSDLLSPAAERTSQRTVLEPKPKSYLYASSATSNDARIVRHGTDFSAL